MNYIDIHCHLDFPDYDADRQDVLERMKEGGVGAITVGTDLESSKKAVELANENENTRLSSPEGSANGGQIWATIGIHPENITSPRSALQSDPLLEAGEGKNIALPLHLGEGQSREAGWDEVKFEELVKNPKVVAIGECGLDYFRLELEEEKNNQKQLFEQQIQFAIKHDKPLMLHVRPARLASESVAGGEAYNDVLDILKNYPGVRGNVHFFAGDKEVAKKFLDLGFTLSFTGVITFTRDYDEVIKYIPQNSIMVETDAPFVTPVPYRGKRNEPVYVIEVVKKMAEIRGEKIEQFSEALFENTVKFFALNDII